MAEKPIRIKHNEVYRITPGGGANGAVTTLDLVCGNCDFKFRRSYHMAQLAQGFPHEVCPDCDTTNYIPYTISGRNDAR